MECCDLDLTLAAGPGGAAEGTLRLWRLEAVEHIPAAPGFAAASASALDEVCPAASPILLYTFTFRASMG